MPKIEIDTRDLPGPADVTMNLDDRSVIERPDQKIEPIEGPTAKDYAAELAFMEESVEIMVAESTDEKSENPIFTAVNGVSQFFFRGQPQTVRRKFVEVLARAKQTDVRTNVYQQSLGAEPINQIRKTTALKYPFSIIRDANPKGAAWLKKILAET